MSKQKNEKQKMATIAEVYNRIIWDTNLNRNMFIAGFHERISDTIREKPLAQWDDNSEIPWHRVRYIRCGEAIVWDREHRIDLVSTNQLPEIAWKSERDGKDRSDLAALVANNQAQFSPRSIYKYDGNEWKIFNGALKSVTLDEGLTIVSYNILSDLHEIDKIHSYYFGRVSQNSGRPYRTSGSYAQIVSSYFGNRLGKRLFYLGSS
jgi:poly(A) polymerase